MKVSEISQIIHTLETDPEFLEGGRLGQPQGEPSYLVNFLEKRNISAGDAVPAHPKSNNGHKHQGLS